jgi:hypothetical protein
MDVPARAASGQFGGIGVHRPDAGRQGTAIPTGRCGWPVVAAPARSALASGSRPAQAVLVMCLPA